MSSVEICSIAFFGSIHLSTLHCYIVFLLLEVDFFGCSRCRTSKGNEFHSYQCKAFHVNLKKGDAIIYSLLVASTMTFDNFPNSAQSEIVAESSNVKF
ncbi:hypothetical protein BFD37_16245 [Escherichia coli]|uniref:Uncharacterized protein n=1 Tax=Escherichia coli O7:K1 (strain IAI39 / ExPEC) TaxID=585057 RepID=A0A0H3MH94_ECO7I|nr:hypothetical protein ECONIH1_06940 [Escherichia coli]CAR18126.1 hypothetical protein ECIAI39_1996 [Escherichia coli IAI39]AQV66823.1 hypothetical protein BE930_08105 [Escherichia coli]KUG94799.1 hypothetical protein ARC92_16465 [Escherichia coli]KUU77684.1 hypothetical protein AWF30_09695 [Escherichia coli]